MAGRGRASTLPAWMTAGGVDTNGNGGGYAPSDQAYGNSNPGQYEDYNSARHPGPESYGPPPSVPPQQYANRAPSNDRYPPREDQYQSHSRPHRQSDRRSSERDSRSTNSAPTGSRIGSWKRGGSRVSNFDVRPPDGVELPPIGVTSTPTGVPNSYFSYANNPAVSGAPLPGTGMAGASKYGGPTHVPQMDPNAAAMQTRHARRIYVGGIPARVTEIEIANFFNDVVARALAPARLDGPPVVKVYLNLEKCYAFVEFTTIELCTACMQLDGLRFDHYTGPTTLRVRRPNDYRPELLAPSNAPIPQLNLAVLGITGSSSAAMGPNKLFVGGLPYNLTDEQVMELMGAFGPIKAFHQVRDPGSVTTKGYGFCEYVNPAHADAAIAGLNGMALGDKTLTIRIASAPANNATVPTVGVQQHMMGMVAGAPQMQQQYSAYGAPPVPGNMGMGGAPASRVLRLSNMVTRDDLYNEAEYQDIREDVRLECLQYGKVNTVIIPRACDNYSPSAEGLIFVEFESTDGARAAAQVLNGRKFADKTVNVGFFSEQEFASQRLI